MTYSGLELAALVKMGVAMASADGKFAEEEKIAIVMELAAFGVGQSDVEGLLRASQTMEASQAFGILASMTTEQKKYATEYLAAIMASDGEIADSEVKMWQLICTLGGFPNMNAHEALSFWHSH